MQPRPFSDLIAPDHRTLMFGPLGLGGQLPVDMAAEHQQRAVAYFQLCDEVPEHTRRSFERLQLLHTYGLFCYDFFTVADESWLLTLDLALSERFMDLYGGTIPFVVASGADRGMLQPLAVSNFDEVYEALRPSGARPAKYFLLRPSSGSRPFRFSAMFSDLLVWARAENLLHGQRNRLLEQVFGRMRNRSAHPRSTSLVMPVDSARSILDCAEIINRLWGHNTPGGRLYPAPLRREVVILGWRPDGSSKIRVHATNLQRPDSHETEFAVLRAAEEDELWQYDSLHESTAYPTELLWGPGSWDGAKSWIEREQPEPDEEEYLDRIFLIRTGPAKIGLPMRPTVAAGLRDEDRDGTWRLIKADYPLDAFNHVRNQQWASPSPCSSSGPCDNCAVEDLGGGRLDSMLRRCRELGHSTRPERPVRFTVPGPWSRLTAD